MNWTKDNVRGGKLHDSDVGVSVIFQSLYRSISTQSPTILRIFYINDIISFPLIFWTFINAFTSDFFSFWLRRFIVDVTEDP